ncbi:unnamed protein product [Rhizopus stolonifer]
MYTRSTSAHDYQKTNHWGPFRRHTSQKITPLVRFYEKSAGAETPIYEPKEPLEEISIPELLESPQSSSVFTLEDILESPAKKSQTCPDLTFCEIEGRPLPPLPTDPKPRASQRMTRALSKGQMHLKRTTTWIGVPVQKLFASPPVHNFGALMSKKYHSAAENMLRFQSNLQTHMALSNSEELNFHRQEKDTVDDVNNFIYQTDHDHCTFIRNQVSESNNREQGSLNQKVFVAPKRIMHCRVMQIINVGSDRDCEYTLFVYHNGVEQSMQRGSMHKIDNNLSADRPQEDSIRLEVQEPFSLTFAVAARYTNTRLRDGLAKIGVLPTSSKTTTATDLPPTGYSVLSFENKQNIKHHGISRFKLTKTEERKGFLKWFNIELVVDIKIVEEVPPIIQKYPWAHKLTESHSIEYGEQDCEIISNPTQVKLSQQYCQTGDFLTIYTRGMAHPAWKRYWVSLEGTRLVLYDFTHKTSKEPLDTLSLMPLQRVNKPSIDDCENVGIARKIGITLQFDRLKAVLSEDVHFDDGEVLEGKAFIYCDGEESAVHWRRALTAYAASFEMSDENEASVDLRFLW